MPVRALTVTVLVLVSLASAAGQQSVTTGAGTSAAATMALADDLVASMKRNNPEMGTFFGLPDADHAGMTDNSLQARDQRRREIDAFHERLEAIDAQALAGRPEWVIYGFVREALETSIATRVCESELWAVSQMGGWHTNYSQLARLQPIETEQQQQAALTRFRALGTHVDREIANLREGLRLGYSVPRQNVQQVMTQASKLTEPDSPYFEPAERTKSPEFAKAWREMVASVVTPGLRKYEAFLRDEYLSRARDTVAVSALPNGAACYKARLRSMISLPVTPQEVHQTGLAELERIRTAEQEIARRMFGDPDLDKAFARLQQPEHIQTDRDATMALARAAAVRAEKALPRIVTSPPKTPVVIAPIPAAEEATAADRYQIGTPDGKRPGMYQINLQRWVGDRKGDLETVVFHETTPGHHMQIMISLERPQAHLVTKVVGTTAFMEGWGLYAEKMADELQLYSSDEDRLGMYQSRAFRAARLVVDTGLHALGWPRQKAIDFMKAHHLGADDKIVPEIDRYIIIPGQATAYMMGALEIERLRAEEEKRLGSAFDLRRFHDAVLEDGAITLPMLREKLRTRQ